MLGIDILLRLPTLFKELARQLTQYNIQLYFLYWRLSVGAYENTKGGLLNQNNLIILGILELSGLLRRKILTAQAINEEEQFEEIVVCEYHGARQ